MKRDFDLIRQILFEMEDAPNWNFVETDEEDDPGLRRIYDLRLLQDDALIASNGKYSYRMTSRGHDYLDSIRDEGIWKSTKEMVAETGGSATLEIVKSLALGLLKQKITKHTGLDL